MYTLTLVGNDVWPLVNAKLIENRKKVTSSDESQFLLQYSDGIGSDFQSMRALIHVVQGGDGVMV